jgi:phosphate transport system permease protein
MDNSNNDDNKVSQRKTFFRRGEPQVWFTGGALMLILLSTFTLICVVLVNGFDVFWPHRLVAAELDDGTRVMGEIKQRTPVAEGEGSRIQLKVGNRDLYGLDFRWVDEDVIESRSYPEDAVTLERQEYGNFYGFFVSVEPATVEAAGATDWERFLSAWRAVEAEKEDLDALNAQVRKQSYALERERLRRLKQNYRQGVTGDAAREPSPAELETKAELDEVVAEKDALLARLRQNTATFADADGRERVVPLIEIVRVYQPNAMGLSAKLGYYGGKVVELFLGQPRESNTEGGLFPAIFGTVMLVFLMSLFSFPLGVVAGVYLREYARDGVLVRLVRIGVNNLAGIPSIVYGIFGLGFFVYGVGGTIDQIFFPERLPTPTYGTGGILWASLTLGLLTVPVVIVSTEEALGAIPQGIREGSLALGATKFQTLTRILLPMSSPGIMTGFILAMARAAGEVAPLMITGVVKLAPALPLDGNFPYIHPDRKFMHLGFHIYDIGFQSPNVEAAKPMVYVTTLLLVGIVLVMSSVAIVLRNRMKKRYSVTGF